MIFASLRRNLPLWAALLLFLSFTIMLIFSYRKFIQQSSAILDTQAEMNYWPMSQVELSVLEYLAFRAELIAQENPNQNDLFRTQDAYAQAWSSVTQILRVDEISGEVARVSGALANYEAIRSYLELSEPYLKRLDHKAENLGLTRLEQLAFRKNSAELMASVRKVSGYPLASARAQVQDIYKIKATTTKAQNWLLWIFLGTSLAGIALVALIWWQRQHARHAHRLLLSAVEAMPDGFAFFTKDKKLELANNAFKQHFDLPARTKGLPFHTIASQKEIYDPQIIEFLIQLFEHAEGQDNEIQTKKGKWQRWLVKRSPHDQRILTLIDMSAHKKREQELEDAKLRAEQGERSKAAFLATMSHEIRTPMHGLINMSALLLETNLDTTQNNYARTLNDSAHGLLVILNDILDLSKLDAGKLTLEHINFEPRALIQSLINLMRPSAEEKGLTLDFDILPNVPQFIVSDPARLRQILLNILGNAVKFTEQGQVHLLIRAVTKQMLRFEIQDTGIGISPQQIEGLFDAFNQADSRISRRFGGTGLGLAISKRLCALLGGNIGVQSNPGEGTVFWFTIPLEIAQNGETFFDVDELTPPLLPPHSDNESPNLGANARHQEIESSSEDKPVIRILMAEDSAVNRDVVIAMLKTQTIKLDCAIDGTEALALASQNSYDLILMDISMPGMDGLEATAQIRKLAGPASEVPIVAITANASDSDRDTCLSAGMDDFISKPFSKAQLLDVIQVWADHSSNLKSEALSDLPLTPEAEENAALAPLVNQTGLTELCSDVGKEAVYSLILGFWDQIEAHKKHLEEAVRKQDAESIKHTTHTIKGAALTYGAQKLGLTAKAIEMRAHEGKLEEATQHYQDLLALIKPSKEALNTAIAALKE